MSRLRRWSYRLLGVPAPRPAPARANPYEEAALTGDPPEPVTEDQLLYAGRQLARVVFDLDSPNAQLLDDIARWLLGEQGAPGTSWPVRLPLPDAEVPAAADPVLPASVLVYRAIRAAIADLGSAGPLRATSTHAAVLATRLIQHGADLGQPGHEWACPSCGTATRARMADR